VLSVKYAAIFQHAATRYSDSSMQLPCVNTTFLSRFKRI